MRFGKTALLVLALSAVACSESPPPEPPPRTTVENAALGVKLAVVPEGLETTVNEGEVLELRPTAEGVEGRLWFSVGPEEHAVNLVVAVEDHRAFIEEQLGGEYQGAQELKGDLGVAFYSRGRFSEGDTAMEETVLFLIHPTANRLLEIHYRYPAANDSAARVEKLIEVLAELE